MRKVSLLILFLILSLCGAWAQNWQPVNLNYSYNYQLTPTEYITNTVKVDSVLVVNNDSVFYLNRIMTNCDTCPDNEYNQFALKNQPQFLMREMVKESPNSFLFQDNEEFRIEPQSSLNESWIYSVSENIDAEITFAGEETFMGVADSVKHISLSTGEVIKIAKNHGIIQFPAENGENYELIGIDGEIEVGEHLPNFWDFYDYEVGDVFQRLEYFYDFGSDSQEFDLKNFEITSKEVLDDRLIYTVTGWKVHLDHFYPEPEIYHVLYYSSLDEVIVYVDSLKHWTNSYPGKMVNLTEFSHIYGETEALHKTEINKTEEGYEKTIGTQQFRPFHHDLVDSELLISNEGSPLMSVFVSYKENCGNESEWNGFEHSGGSLLQSKIHNGDTIGKFIPLNALVNMGYRLNYKTEIYPNPVKENQTLKIKSKERVNSYKLYNITGRLVSQGKLNDNTIKFENQKAGIYFLNIYTANENYRKKIIITH